jgi:L-lactate dehydrogenase complex protein LldF
VKIPIPKILLHLRHRVVEGDEFDQSAAPKTLQIGARLGGLAFSTPWLYRLGTRLLPVLQVPLRQDGWLPKLPAPVNRWTKVRPFPAFVGGFRQWWAKRR